MQKIRDLEEEYLNKHNSYQIEQSFLYSFSKDGLKQFISSFRVDYNLVRVPYTIKLNKLKNSKVYKSADEISKYFLEQIHYHFEGGIEVENKRKILEKLTSFYTLNHTDFLSKTNQYQHIDVHSIPIERVIGYYLSKNLENTRKNIMCPFPDHRDKSPSFHIYKNKNIFVCFGCGKKGNAVNFISYMENIDKKEAFKKFIKLTQI